MQGELQALLKLQETDIAVAEVESELRQLDPMREALDNALQETEVRLEAARDAARDAENRRAELESRIESYRVMQERRRQRLEWVKGAKEASTLMAELDLARSVLAKEEAEWMRSSGALQEAEQLVAEVEQAVEELRIAQAPEREAMAAKAAEHEERLDLAAATRQQAATGVRAQLLMVYERVLRGRAPQALYPLRSGACGHCFTAVPLHRRHEIKNGESFAPCEACGVLIYLDAQDA